MDSPPLTMASTRSRPAWSMAAGIMVPLGTAYWMRDTPRASPRASTPRTREGKAITPMRRPWGLAAAMARIRSKAVTWISTTVMPSAFRSCSAMPPRAMTIS